MMSLSRTSDFIDVGLVHQSTRYGTCPDQGRRLELRSLFENRSKAFVEDLVGPSRPDDARLRDADEQVTKRRRIKDARVVDDDECHGSVSEAVLLRLCGQLV